MKNFFKLIILSIISFTLISCSGTVNSVDGKGEGAGHVYVISEAIAKRLMMAAMKSEFNPEDIKTLASPKLGFSSNVQYGIDKDTVELRAAKAEGVNEKGISVSGFVFSAEHSGTAPAAGSPTIARLLAHVVKDAETLGNTANFVKLVK